MFFAERMPPMRPLLPFALLILLAACASPPPVRHAVLAPEHAGFTRCATTSQASWPGEDNRGRRGQALARCLAQAEGPPAAALADRRPVSTYR